MMASETKVVKIRLTEHPAPDRPRGPDLPPDDDPFSLTARPTPRRSITVQPPRLAEQAMDLIEAIRDRRERACGVAREYHDEQAGPMSWVVSHPEGGERTYLVDLGLATCTCPDFTARMNPAGLPVCKHILAVAARHGYTVEIE